MLDHNRAQANAFVTEFNVPHPNIYDDAGLVAAKFEEDAPPSIVLVDSRG